jgi:hypothetical protein
MISGGASSDTATNKITWDNNVFNTILNYTQSDSTAPYDHSSTTITSVISGAVAPSGSELLTIQADYSKKGGGIRLIGPADTYVSYDFNSHSALELVNIITAIVSNDSIVFSISGPGAQLITKKMIFSDENSSYGNHGHPPSSYSGYYQSMDWFSIIDPPQVVVTLYK